jgi:pleiotropic regulator 1
MNGGLVLTNQKRTRVLFDPDLSLPPEEDESAVRMKLKMKMRSEYANALELPPAIIQKEQTAREKRLREQIEQQQQKLKAEFELVASDDKQSFEQVTIEELVEEDTKAIRAASSSAGAMSSGKELVLLGDQKGGMQMMARTVKPGESFDSATSRAALIRTQLVHQTPKPTWHAPWKLMRVISGHLGWVRCVAVDVSNQWFATGAADRVIKVRF